VIAIQIAGELTDGIVGWMPVVPEQFQDQFACTTRASDTPLFPAATIQLALTTVTHVPDSSQA
jgi:hypothetical protein